MTKPVYPKPRVLVEFGPIKEGGPKLRIIYRGPGSLITESLGADAMGDPIWEHVESLHGYVLDRFFDEVGAGNLRIVKAKP